ncbi:MAG TPA: TetR/AcrR family transcriptional regulator [Rhizomicrobium sp.]|nr:TetR/AcrR family transcriptional regulator [Rhizomicrobium sp.]
MPRVLTQADIDQFRNRLCDVAARLYFEVGHSDFQMRDLASRVGVSAMTPYRYFGDKDGILAAVRTRGVARLADQLEAAVSQGPAAVMQTYIRFAMEEAAYYRLIFDLSQPRTRLTDLTGQERRVRSAMLAAFATEPSKSEAETMALSLWAALHGAICMVLAGKLSESELGDLGSRLSLAFFGVSHQFVVPSLQVSPSCGAPGTSETSRFHGAAAANIAAE